MAKYILVHGIRVCNEFTPETFGRLTTIGPVFSVGTLKFYGSRRHRLIKVACVCACGDTDVYEISKLRLGHTKSCGCYCRDMSKDRATRHGGSKTQEYRIFHHMTRRCYEKQNQNYADYGGRGITVCDRWREPNGQGFINFLADMGNRPSSKHEIDRHPNNNGNYEPGNCRWATRKEQNRNTRQNRNITHNGKTQCLAAWGEEKGIDGEVISYRLGRGWSIVDAIETPLYAKPNSKQEIPK